MRSRDAVFFLSGLAALVDETIWARLLSRVLGSDASGTALVLAVFMAGMGAGAAVFSGLARRTRSPLILYAVLEGTVALWAAASPWLLEGIEPVHGLGARALVSALVLLPPTLAMGATFPLMARMTIATPGETGERTGGFYGANTLGACAGALLGPFLLMPWLGLTGALLAAAAISATAGGLAQRIRLPLAAPVEAPAASPAAGPRPSTAGWLWLAPFLLGSSALALEVLLTRTLIAVTGASVYAFALVLAVFLAGIGLGSRQAARTLARPRRAEALLRDCALLVPLLTLGGVLALRWQLGERDLFGSLANRMPGPETGALVLWASHALFAGLILFPAGVAFGAALPAAAAAVAARRTARSTEDSLGRVYAANTAGATLGALLAGFVLLPLVGPRWGLALALLPCPLAALIAGPGDSRRAALAVGGAFLLGIWALAPGPRAGDLLELRCGSFATAAVEEWDEPGGGRVRALRVNGKVVATTAPVDLRLQRLLGLVPGVLHGEVREALVIGLGTGMTPGALLALPDLERLEVVEISGAVRDASRRFDRWNGAVLEDPRTALAIADGRHALATSDRRWDLITSDPIHPWARGSSDLYALEHFRRIAEHLEPGGVASQWLPLYQLSTDDVRTVVATWLAVFPESSAWLTAYDLALVGWRDAEPGGAMAARDFPAAVAESLALAGVHSPAELWALRVADGEDLAAFAAGARPMHDDRPVLEFRAPRSYLAGYCLEVLEWAGRADYVESLPASSRARARELRGLVHRFIERVPQGWSHAARTYGEELLALPPLGR